MLQSSAEIMKSCSFALKNVKVYFLSSQKARTVKKSCLSSRIIHKNWDMSNVNEWQIMPYIPHYRKALIQHMSETITQDDTGKTKLPNLWQQEVEVQTTRSSFQYQQHGHNFSVIILPFHLYLPLTHCRLMRPRTSHFPNLWILELFGFFILS